MVSDRAVDGRCHAVTLLLCCLFVSAASAPGVAALESPAGESAVASQADEPLAQTGVEADTVSLRATISSDGTATWRVAYRIELADDNETAAFADLQQNVESDPGTYRQQFEQRMARMLRAAENATGRTMSMENVSVRATREPLPQGEYGVLTYRLDWLNFATVEGQRLQAGDAIDRFFLRSRESLTVAWPEGYDAAAVEPTPSENTSTSVTWQGRRDFDPGEPRLDLAPASPADSDGIPVLVLAGAVVLVAALVGSGWWLSVRRAGRDAGPDAGTDETASGAAATDDSNLDADEGPPPDLLRNEERVLALLEDRGGRIKQQRVAEELDWTAAKTSQVVGDLRGAGEIDSFRLGRENVLTLPEVSLESGDEGTEDADVVDDGDGAV